MAGYDLKEESYIQKQMTEDELWSVFSAMFSNKVKHDTSYKFGFFKSILDSLYNADENLVLSCSGCNLKKSDKLTPKYYVDTLIARNDTIIERDSRKILSGYKDEKLRYIYYWAKCNGYNQIWTPGKRGHAVEKV